MVRVLVVGAGLGTNAGLGLEVPLAHGKLVTDGRGGFREISAEVRSERSKRPEFAGFMAESFSYLWERPEGYLGNGGYIYGVLLGDELQVDVLQHPVTQADREAVGEAALLVEAEALRKGSSATYAASIALALNRGRYDVAMAGSKGLSLSLMALELLERPIPWLWLNGAEAPSGMDVGHRGLGPDFAKLGTEILEHPKVPRLVLSSHGAPISAALRAALGSVQKQRVALVSSEDHRCVPNRENHSLPWSLTFPSCWHVGYGRPPRLVTPHGATALRVPSPLGQLLLWAAGGEDRLLELQGFPGPKRFAWLRVELARGGHSLTLTSKTFTELPRTSDMQIYDIFFDAQADARQVMLKHVLSGDSTPLREILDREGQFATRRLRFFRYYTDRCKELEGLSDVAQHMVHELLAMNKNLCNFLCTSWASPKPPRFGDDLLELIVEVELGHLGSAYYGFSRGLLDAEHRLTGHYSLLGDHMDSFLSQKAHELREQRLQSFLATEPGEQQLRQFRAAEEYYFQNHPVKQLDGYVRRELTIDHQISHVEVQQELQAMDVEELGHGTNFRFFVDGRCWLSAGCLAADMEYVRGLTDRAKLYFRDAAQLSHDRYQEVPSWMLPPTFRARNGYQVLAYRKFSRSEPTEIWMPDFGPCELSKNFGQYQALPAKIGRGTTSGRRYLYDSLHPGELYEEVQANRLAWWELQLYPVESSEPLFDSEEQLQMLLLRNLFEQDLAAAKSLWLAGLKKDGLSRSQRPFPGQEDELAQLVDGMLQRNLELQRQKAEKSFSMRPTNAKRAAATGNFSMECRDDICRELLAFPKPGSHTKMASRCEVVQQMNRGLRSCFHAATASVRGSVVNALRETLPDPLLQRYRERLAHRLQSQDTFTDLQTEVNAILRALSPHS